MFNQTCPNGCLTIIASICQEIMELYTMGQADAGAAHLSSASLQEQDASGQQHSYADSYGKAVAPTQIFWHHLATMTADLLQSSFKWPCCKCHWLLVSARL